jgi:small-conductance mechanosensitive channel
MDRRAIAQLLLGLCLFGPGIVCAQTKVDPTAATEPLAPDFGKGAEEVAAQLREMMRSLSDTAVFTELEAEVAADTQRSAACWNETGRLLGRSLRTTALDSLTTLWQTLRGDLDDVNGRIELRARRREADLATLTALHESWAHAVDLARKANAPQTVLDRLQNTVATIDQTRPLVEQRRARVMVLQDAVTRALQTSDDALARLADARRDAIRRALSPQEPPIWRPSRVASDVPTFAADMSTKVDTLRLYVTAYRGGLVASGLIILALMILFRRGARRAAGGVEDGSAAPQASIHRRPYAAAILVGLLITRPLRPNPPFEFQQFVLAVVMIAALRVLRPFLASHLMAGIYACGALLLASLASQLLEPQTGFEQMLLLVEMAMTAGVLFWGAAQFAETRPTGVGTPISRKVGRSVARLLAVVCAVSALAAAFGYLDLADFLGLGTFFALLLAFGLLAVRLVFHDGIAIGLARWPLARLHSVALHRARVEQRGRNVVDVGLAVAWISIVLGRFQLLEPTRAALNAALDARLQAGELDLPVGHVLAFVFVVVGVALTTRIAATLLEEDVYSRMTLPRGVPYALSTLTRYTLLLAGFLLALATLGLDLTKITVLVSALGLGLGFGLQQIMNNFVSGLILLFERPVQVGDSIEMGDLSGDVLRIGIRSSTVRTSQGAEVIVPNSKMIEERVTNWTLSDRRRRIALQIGVKGDVDAERIIDLLTDVARRDARVSPTPPPEALLIRFGGDTTDFELRFWTDDIHWTRLRSDLSISLQRMLRAVRAEDTDGTASRPPSSVV